MKQFSAQLTISAYNPTLLAFAVTRRAAAALLLLDGYRRAHSSNARNRWDRQTDALTSYWYIDPAACYASSSGGPKWDASRRMRESCIPIG